MPRLTKQMSVAEFDNGYWYVGDLRALAATLGVAAASRLRKNELEEAIRHFLAHGELVPVDRNIAPKAGARDLDRGLRLDLPVRHYMSNRETKDFILGEARKLEPGLRKRPGVSYRLNRWREAEIAAGRGITYGDLVRQFIALNKVEGFERVPHGRYINFIADFLRSEPGATRAEAVAAWHRVKDMDVPKTYAAWRKAAAGRRKGKTKG